MYVISRDSTNKTRSLYCNSTAEKKKWNSNSLQWSAFSKLIQSNKLAKNIIKTNKKYFLMYFVIISTDKL